MLALESKSNLSFKNTFGLFVNNSYHVDNLFKKLAHRLDGQLGTSDYRTVLGSYPSRWKAWNKNFAPLHFIYRKRFSPYSVTIVNVMPMNVPLWRLAITFLTKLCTKRNPKVIFVGNPNFFPLSQLVHEKLHTEFGLFYIRAINHWIPGFAGNIRSMFLPHTPTQKGHIRDVRGVRLKNVRNHRGQFYERPREYSTYKFMYNYFYPECFILLNSSGRAYNADKEVLKKAIPTIAMCSTDTKSFAFSGCMFTIPAGVNYEDHLYYYVFMFYVIIAHARSNFLYKEYLSLQTNPLRPYKRVSQVYVTPSKKQLVKRFVETYQKALNIYGAKIRHLEYLQVVEEDSDVLNNEDEEATLLRKWRKWGIPKETTTESRKYKSYMVYNNFSGREAVIKSEHLKRSAENRVFDKMYDNINLIGYAFQTIVSIVLLQHVYMSGVAFMEASPRYLNNKIVLFQDQPGCRLLIRLLSVVDQEKNNLNNDFSRTLPPFVTLFSRNLICMKSLVEYKNFVLARMGKFLGSKGKDMKDFQKSVSLTAVNESKGRVAGKAFVSGVASSINSLVGLIKLRLTRRPKKYKEITSNEIIEKNYQKYLRRLKIDEHRAKKDSNYVTQRDPTRVNVWDTLPSYIHDYDKENVVFRSSKKKYYTKPKPGPIHNLKKNSNLSKTLSGLDTKTLHLKDFKK